MTNKKKHHDDDYFRMSGGFAHFALWLSIAFLVVMLVWAYYAVLDEVTTAQGKVIPSQKTKVIQNLEGGMVKEISVHEGQEVNKGQVLMRLDDIKFSSSYREGLLKQQALEIRLARLESELNSKPFKISAEAIKQLPELVAGEEALYFSKKQELRSLQNQKTLLQKEIAMTAPLVREGAVSEVELLKLRQQLHEINGNISRFRSSSLQELNATKAEESRLEVSNSALIDQLKRTEVRSPVRGIVKQIYVTTIGGVVKPGMPLMEIVPLDDSLLIEAKVRPQDIGFLHSGQEAMVKFTAYDFSIYGGLKGGVEHISADTTVDKDGNSFYEVWVRTKKNYLEKEGKQLRIIPGMQVSIDV
ncbi:MAG: HlyD family efflux transporter periplasmic adaptor subunit, partial [Gammaproteobacteria bacterium]|nr:HlyD family efflux transporter periplasmic adaptor subunit [Gammaproteobacteria bacterium]